MIEGIIPLGLTWTLSCDRGYCSLVVNVDSEPVLEGIVPLGLTWTLSL